LDEPVTININTREGIDRITDILSGVAIDKQPAQPVASPFRRFRGDDKTNVFSVTIPPHSYRVFEYVEDSIFFNQLNNNKFIATQTMQWYDLGL
jgi:hypothetical protein